MPQKPKAKSRRADDEQGPPSDVTSIVEDQNSHVYYYDDAHGYETYAPGEDDEDDAEVELETPPK